MFLESAVVKNAKNAKNAKELITQAGTKGVGAGSVSPRFSIKWTGYLTIDL